MVHSCQIFLIVGEKNITNHDAGSIICSSEVEEIHVDTEMNLGAFIQLCFCTFIAIEVEGNFPFRNVSLPWDVRVEDLVSRLTVEEVILQLSKGGAGESGGPAPGIPRLGIDPYQWNTECLRGDVEAGNATSFPEAIGLAASFSPALIFAVANATAFEVRAKHSDFMRRKVYSDHTGLSCFSPVINIMRHPLWGRNQETYGEDPYMSGTLAEHFVHGLQGDHQRYIKANAGCKHFDAHSGPENIPVSRLSFDAKVTMRDWRLTFLPQFKRCVEAGTLSIMCSYNRLNGIPACAHKQLLTDILRKEWKFTGYVVSDEGALEFSITKHKYFNNSVNAAAASFNAGTNLELSANQTHPVYSYLNQALQQRKITKELLYDRLKPLFYTRMRLGEFDPPEMNPYSNISLSVIQSPAHRELSIQAAMKSFVMLKNDNQLPLRLKIKTLAIVGPMADNPLQLFGDYSPTPDTRFIVTPYKGLKSLANVTKFAAGCLAPSCSTFSARDIQQAVQDTDLTIVCLGTGVALVSENRDRKNFDLPGKQSDLLTYAIDNSPGKVIVLLFSAGPLHISIAVGNPKVTAIFQCFFPAQATGEALRRIFLGSRAETNPAGRLPYTWYASMDQVPSITNYTMVNRTYRYFLEEPLFPFGYGLSYTKFTYVSLAVSHLRLAPGQNQTVKVEVRNDGKVFDGDEVVQVYVAWENAEKLKMPQLQLVGFDRVNIARGPSVTRYFTITPEQLAVWDDARGSVIRPGTITVYAGGQQPFQKTRVPSNVLSTKFTII
ncbi:uncharacterized protein LOC135487892 isoform X1 [Lineus longissimus]|uniref:uncharacterized protein LOC135487892 isoform X1 n=1 Tax=Lineus longissimus TaxID=88925 RepID=UPI00315C66D8